MFWTLKGPAVRPTEEAKSIAERDREDRDEEGSSEGQSKQQSEHEDDHDSFESPRGGKGFREVLQTRPMRPASAIESRPGSRAREARRPTKLADVLSARLRSSHRPARERSKPGDDET